MNTIKLVDFICLLPLSSMYRLFCCINLLLCKTYICTQTLSWDSSWAMLDFLHDSLVGWGETANYMPFFCVFHHLDTGVSDDRQIILITIINTLALLITILPFFSFAPSSGFCHIQTFNLAIIYGILRLNSVIIIMPLWTNGNYHSEQSDLLLTGIS